MPNWNTYVGRGRVAANAALNQPFTDAEAYRTALEKAAYGDAGAQYGQGLGQITNYLASAGPLADSGAATALRAKLYSDIYGKARSRIGSGYADYLAQALQAKRNFAYQQALLKLQKKQNSTGIGGIAGGLAGSFAGPFAGAIGANIGNRLVP